MAPEKEDWNLRELVEDRNERHAKLRQSILWAARIQLVYIFLRTAWALAPSLVVKGHALTTTDAAIFGAGVLTTLLYSFAFGGGEPARERRWAIMLYSVCGLTLGAECGIMFYQYHVLYKERPPLFEYPFVPSLLATHLAGALPRGALKQGFQVAEGVMEVMGLGATMLGAYLVREYVLDKREQEREAEGGERVKTE